MKKRTCCKFALLTLLAVTIVAPARAEAVVSVGLSSWYSWWEIKPDNGSTIDPALLYGAVLGVDFAERWALTSVLLTGKFNSEYDLVGDVEYRRYDSDTAINYSLNRYFKIFAGFKYMRYDLSVEAIDVELKHISYGPGLGLGITLPLSDSLFVIANVSGMYLFGKDTRETEDFVEPGFNTSLSLAYYIASMSTTIMGGVRYQFFETKSDGGDTRHHFYGITLSAVHSFSPGGEKGE